MKKFVNKCKMIGSNMIMMAASLFWKRDKRIVLMGAWFGEKFADNSRFLFQYLSACRESLGLTHVVWATRSRDVFNLLRAMDYEVCLMDTEEAVRYHKKAGYHIICNAGYSYNGRFGDIEGKYSYRAVRINLWHAIAGIKGVECTSNEYLRKRKRHPLFCRIMEFLRMHCRLFRLIMEPGGWEDCFHLSTTPASIDVIQRCLLLPRDHFIESGYPRNCPCPELTENEKMVLRKIDSYHKVILYLPTFRAAGAESVFGGLNDKLSGALEENDILWIQKTHQADETNNLEAGLSGNVLSLGPDFDINVIMPHITMLVTDYSSVANDAVYHKKPVLYYVPDYEEYRDGDRGFALDPDEIMCGPKLFSAEELADAVRYYINEPERAKDSQYENIRGRYWNDKNCMEEIWRDIVKHTADNLSGFRRGVRE